MQKFMRKWHRWISVATALPFLITLITGIILATRSFNPLIQPTSVKLEKGLALSLDQIVEKAAAVPGSGIQSIADISRLDMRIGKGEIRIRPAKGKMQILMNAQTGDILSTEQPMTSLLVELHEGAFFGKYVQFGLFFPSFLGVLFLLVSGLVLFLIPYQVRRKRKLNT
ncbi:PepSY domain-containing protein [Bdellovibrio sp. HCB209]|uniref:PepSY domain-containing protein n=1 Tax=Bdellovibrio sp. HCB209 TaxID=3394354 RepID=UPI0039B41F86